MDDGEKERGSPRLGLGIKRFGVEILTRLGPLHPWCSRRRQTVTAPIMPKT